MNRHPVTAARVSVLSLLASAALLGALAGPATAASFVVSTADDSGSGSLRAAIEAANASAGADTITFTVATPATITLLSALPEITGSLTIDGPGANSLSIVADTGNASRDHELLSVASGVSVTVQDVSLALAQRTGNGGAIENAGSLTINNAVFEGNSATSGGAIWTSGTLTVTASSFEGNTATAGGGAIAAMGSGTVDILGSTFVDNSASDGATDADDGGAIWTAKDSGQTLFLGASTLSGNTAGDDGGGVFAAGGNAILTHVTISGGSAGGDGGAVAREAGTLDVRNSILANSTAGNDCAGTLRENINNLIESGCGTGATALVTADPELAALADNGGPTFTMAITSSSPAYDAASSLYCSVEDQRGEPRNIDDCDIGAYEAADVTGPSVVSVGVPAAGTYRAGQNLDFTVTWTEPPVITGSPEIELNVGEASKVATIASAPSSKVRVFRYTVQAGDSDANGIQVGTLSGGTIKDGAGNNASLTLNNVGSTTAVLVDTTAPTVTSVDVPAADAYPSGATLDFTVNTSEPVTVGGAPRIALTVDAATRYATFQSGSPGSAIVFRYTTQPGDADADGIAVGALELNGGTIADAGGNALVLTLQDVGSTTGVLVDTAAPVVTSVDVPGDGTYSTTEPLEFVVTWDDDVVVGGTPRITLTVDGQTRYATRSFVSGPSVTFRYTPQAGETDTDGIAYGDLIDLNGGSIADAAGNAAALDISAGAATTGVDVDTVAPVASGATVADGLATDIDSQTNTAQMAGNWSGFTDADSGIKAYDYAIDDAAPCAAPFIVNATEIGLVTEYTATGLSLTPTSTYYWCVRAIDQAGNTSDWVASDGVLIEENPTNNAPVCTPGSVTVVMNVAKAGSAGCTDSDAADTLAYRIDTDGANGSATVNGAGTWTYTPDLNYVGGDTFTVVANDGTVDSAPATFTVTVANQPISAKNDVVSIPPLSARTLNVLANDSPGTGEAGQPLTITAVTQGAKGRVTNKGTSVSYDPTSCNTGNDSFTYTVTDGQASPQIKTVAVTILRPGQGGLSSTPRTDTPAVGFISGSTMTTTVPMKLSWCGVTTSTTSVRGYRVLQSTNGSSTSPTYGTTLFSSTTARSSTRSLSVNQDYRWRVRTTDTAGRTGSYATSPVSIVRRYQDSSSRITYTGTWGTSTSGTPSGGTQRYTAVAGRSAQITVTNVRSFAIVGPRSSTRGSFRVYVDDVLVATVSQKSSTSSYRRVLYARNVTAGTAVSHTIRVEVVGNGRVDLDAILTLAAN